MNDLDPDQARTMGTVIVIAIASIILTLCIAMWTATYLGY